MDKQIKVITEVFTEESVKDGESDDTQNEINIEVFEDAIEAGRYLKDKCLGLFDRTVYQDADDEIDMFTGDRSRNTYILEGFTDNELTLINDIIEGAYKPSY